MTKKTEKIFVLNDLHIPYIDKRSYSAVRQCMKDEQPDLVILAGDIIDFESISRFSKTIDDARKLKYEIRMTKEWFNDLRSVVPNARIVSINSNHEIRMENYLQIKAPELLGLEELTFKSLLNLDSLNIERVDELWWEYRGTMYSHIDKSSANPGASAKSIGLENMCDVVHAHTHRAALIRYNDYTFIENGCLCIPQQKYLKKPSDFTQAFTVVHISGRNEKHYNLIPVKGHGFYYGNKKYQG